MSLAPNTTSALRAWPCVLALPLVGCAPKAAPPPAPPPSRVVEVPAAPTPSTNPPPADRHAAGPEPLPAAPEPTEAQCGKGMANRELIAAASALSQEARACYQAGISPEMQSSVAPEGRLMVSFEVEHEGSVRAATITSDTLNAPVVADCVRDLFLNATLPPTTRGCVVINVPIVFRVKDPQP